MKKVPVTTECNIFIKWKTNPNCTTRFELGFAWIHQTFVIEQIAVDDYMNTKQVNTFHEWISIKSAFYINRSNYQCKDKTSLLAMDTHYLFLHCPLPQRVLKTKRCWSWNLVSTFLFLGRIYRIDTGKFNCVIRFSDKYQLNIYS